MMTDPAIGKPTVPFDIASKYGVPPDVFLSGGDGEGTYALASDGI